MVKTQIVFKENVNYLKIQVELLDTNVQIFTFHAFCVQPIMNLKHWMLVEVAIVMSWVLAGRSCHFCETGSDTLPDPRIHLVAAPASL